MSRRLSLPHSRLSGLLRAQDVTCKLTGRKLSRANIPHARLRCPPGRSLSRANIPLPGCNGAGNLRSKLLRSTARLAKLRHTLSGCAQSKPLCARQGTLTRCNRARNLLSQSDCASARLFQGANTRLRQVSCLV